MRSELSARKFMRKDIALDAGPLVALFVPDDIHHERASAFIAHTSVPTFTTMAVVTEVMYLLDFSVRNQLRFLEWIGRGATEVLFHEARDWNRYSELVKKYQDFRPDFADVTLVTACERRQTRRVA